MTTLQLLDADDATAFDFLDSAGTTNPYGLKSALTASGFDLGSPVANRVLFEGEDAGGLLTRQRYGLVETTFTISIGAQATADEAMAGVGELGRLLAKGGTIKWVPETGQDTRYIDFISGDLPTMFRGQDVGLLRVLTMKRDVSLPIRVIRQPYLRGDENPLRNTLQNPLLVLDSALDGRPDGWAWDNAGGVGTESWEEATYAYKFDLTGAVTRYFRQTVMAAVSGEVWTMSVDAKVASPGQVGIRVEFLDSADVVLATDDLAASSLATFTRRTKTTAAAPANTAKVRASLVASNSAVGPATYRLRLPQLEKASSTSDFAVGGQFVTNDPAVLGGCVLPLFAVSEMPTGGLLILEGETGASVVEILGARRSGRRSLYDYVNETKAAQLDISGNGWTRTLGTDSTATADASASGGNMVRSTHTTTPATAARRARVTRTTRLDSLRGEFDVWVRVKAAAARDYRLQLRWGLGTPDPVPFTEDEITWNLAGSSSWDWVMQKLGKIKVPEEPAILGGLTLELWTRMAATPAATLDADYFFLVPSDERVGTLKVPTGLTAVAATEQVRSDASGQPPRPEKTNQPGQHLFLLDAEGPPPVELPGMEPVILALKVGDTITAGNVRPKDVLGRAPTVTVRYAPRFVA
ncbi:MAG: hypothetical protein ACRDHM_07410 [Actinomycetota bacterium]